MESYLPEMKKKMQRAGRVGAGLSEGARLVSVCGKLWCLWVHHHRPLCPRGKAETGEALWACSPQPSVHSRFIAFGAAWSENTLCSSLLACHGHRLSEFVYLTKKRGLAQSQPGSVLARASGWGVVKYAQDGCTQCWGCCPQGVVLSALKVVWSGALKVQGSWVTHCGPR